MRSGPAGVFALFIAVLFWAALSGARADEVKKPFEPGEALFYRLRWTIIPAGEAMLGVVHAPDVGGEPAYHFILEARSNAFIDAFYKVRDRIDAYADLGMTRSLFYEKQQLEGSTKRNVKVRFDWAGKKAAYENFGKVEKTVDLMDGAFDPLSIFFYSRGLDLKKGAVFQRPVTDGKKCVMGVARVIRRETISVNEVKYDTWLMEPDLEHVGGVFEKSRDASIRLWVTADDRRIPVRIQSKVAVGSFVGELTKIQQVPVPDAPPSQSEADTEKK